MNALSQFGILRIFNRPSVQRLSLRTLLSVAKERRDLRNLPADRLNDIGYTQTEAEKEANRPAWDVPHHWKR